MGKKPAAREGFPMWVATADLPKGAGHPFYERLNRVLEESGFDAFVEGLCSIPAIHDVHDIEPTSPSCREPSHAPPRPTCALPFPVHSAADARHPTTVPAGGG